MSVMSAWLELGLFVLLAAATSVGATTAIRQAPWIRTWNEQGIKPWGCDLCMSFWVTLLVVGIAIAVPRPWQWQWIGAWMPAFAIAYSWLTRLTPAPLEIGELPGLPDELPRADPRDESE